MNSGKSTEDRLDSKSNGSNSYNLIFSCSGDMSVILNVSVEVPFLPKQ